MDNRIPPVPPVSPPLPQGQDWPKILLIVIGFLVILGLFGNLYLLARNQKPVTEITPTPSPLAAVPTLDVTANWKTYTNIKYNYEFKYPIEYKITERESGGLLLQDDPQRALLYLVVRDNKNRQAAKQWIENEPLDGPSVLATHGVLEESLPQFTDAIRLTNKESPAGYKDFKIIGNKDGLIYYFNFGPKIEDYNLSLQILSTFRFLQ